MSNNLDTIRSSLDALWDQLVAKSESLNRKALAWGALALAGIILLSVNLLSWSTLRGWNVDMTQDSLYTISDGTKQILRNIDEPISAKLYFSRKLGEAGPQYARYFDRVRALLEQYRDISSGKLELAILDPEPFSDAEDRAVASGLRGVRLNTEGEVGYFGLAATNSTDNEHIISFFSPERESFLEYDVTKLIYALTNPRKRIAGLMTTLPMDGGQIPANMMAGQPPRDLPPWLIMDQIREFFNVEKVEQNVSEIPSRIDVLIVAQPTELTPQAAYAIDQYALNGGKVLVFADPTAESAQMTLMAKAGAGRTNLASVLKAWGVDIDYTKAAADIKNARRVQFGGRDAQGMVTEFVAWLTLGRSNIEQSDVLSNGIDVLQLASAASLQKVEGASTEFTPIIKTSTDAMEIDARKVGLGADPRALLRDYVPGGKALTLAARLSGEAKTAFPKGRPFEEEAELEKNPEAKKEAEERDKAKQEEAAKSGEGPSLDLAKEGHVASGRINVIVVGDTDLLADRFWAETRQVMGQEVVMPTSNNASFVLGALENLSGSDALIALRGRGVRERPFTLVEDIRRDAERQFREKEDALTKKLTSVQSELAKLEQTGKDGAVVVTDSERKSIDRFKSQMLETRRELRSVKLALRHDIDSLDAWLKFANIALVPILLGLGGLAWSIWNARRQ